MTFELCDDNLVPAKDHLVEEEVETVGAHLATHGVVVRKPHVRLFGDGGVEVPAAVVVLELWEVCRVAVFLTVGVRDLVLRGEVEGVDRQVDVGEESFERRVIACVDMLAKQAVVVEIDMLGLPSLLHSVPCIHEELLEKMVRNSGAN